MIDSDHGGTAITMCSGTGPVTAMMDMPGMHGDASDHRESDDHGKTEMPMPCAFSGLSTAALKTIDPIQIAALIAFVMAIGFASRRIDGCGLLGLVVRIDVRCSVRWPRDADHGIGPTRWSGIPPPRSHASSSPAGPSCRPSCR